MNNVLEVKEALSKQGKKVVLAVTIIISSILIDMAVPQTLFLSLILSLVGLGILSYMCFKKWWILKQNEHLFERYDSNYNKARYYNILACITVLIVIPIILFATVGKLFYVAIALGIFYGVITNKSEECERSLK